MPTIWNGTPEEAADLQRAIAAHCLCCYEESSGVRTFTCAPHKALVEDQRFLDGMVFGRRMAEALIEEEMEV